jgi:tetratricopeptide (TPR) repeat protein
MNRPLNRNKVVGAIWAVTALFLLIFSSGLSAQQLDRVEEELGKTDRLIEQAHQIVGESGSEQGWQYLEKAVFLQENAWDHYLNRQLYQAERLTFQAREHAEKAISIIRKDSQERGTVERELDRTDELIQQARERLDMSSSKSGMATILESALTTQNTARELYLQNRQKMALTATLRARELIQKGIESVQETNQAFREIERTEMVMDRARDMLGQLDLNQAPPAFENALQMQTRARELYDEGNHKLAQEYTLRARRQILEGINRFEQQMQRENFPNLLNDIEAKLERTRSELRNSESDMGQRLLERSRNEINSAKEAFNGGDVQRAMFHLRRANRYLGEAAEIVSP